MPHFVYDNTALFFPKTNLNPLPVGADPTQYVQDIDWNTLNQAAVDIRDMLRGAEQYGLEEQAVDPLPAGIDNYLWLETGGALYLHTGGSPGSNFDLTAGGSGEANTASNVNVGGVGVFKQKVGVNLEFKGINAGSSKISVVDEVGNNEIDIDVVEANVVHQNLSGAGTNTHAQIDTHIGLFEGVAQGAIWYSSAGGTAAALGPGTAGQFLRTQGAAADPVWASPAVTVQDEGVGVTNTPHTILNFTGVGVSAADGGGGVVNISIAGGGGTLDDSYDFGGAGAGRTIDVTDGAVVFQTTETDGTNVVEINKSPTGSDAGNGLDVVMGGNATGHGVNVAHAGSGNAINVPTGNLLVGTSVGSPALQAPIQAQDDAGDNAWMQVYNGDSDIALWTYASSSGSGFIAQIGAEAATFDPGLQLLSGVSGDTNTCVYIQGSSGSVVPWPASTQLTSVALGGANKNWAAGNLTNQRDNRVFGVTYTATGASVFTNAATLAVEGPPSGGLNVTITNPASFWVENGNTFIDDGIEFVERADHYRTPPSGKGALWLRNDSPNKLIFTDGAGTDWDLTSGGGGTDLTGLGVDNRLARWDGTDTLQVSLWSEDDTGNMTAGGALIMNDETLVFDVDGDTGFVTNGDDNVDFSLAGTDIIRWNVSPFTTFVRSGLVDTEAIPTIRLVNETAATVGVPRQNSPSIDWIGSGWDGAVSDEVRFSAFVDAVDATTTVQGVWSLAQQMSGGAVTTVFSVNQGGDAVIAGDLTVSGNLAAPLVSLDASADIDLNGVASLLLDADGNSFIDASGDDTVRVTTGGSQRIEISNTALRMVSGNIDLDGVADLILDGDADSHFSVSGDDDILLTVGAIGLREYTSTLITTNRNSVGITSGTVAERLQNNTAATSGNPQYSPMRSQSGSAYDGVDSAIVEIGYEVRANQASEIPNPPVGSVVWMHNIDGAGFTEFFAVGTDQYVYLFGGGVAYDADGDTYIDALTDDELRFVTGASARMTLTSAGLVMSSNIDLDGTYELVLDADGDSKIYATTDDVIDIECGTNIIARFSGSGAINPGSANSYDFGGSGNRWRSAWWSGAMIWGYSLETGTTVNLGDNSATVIVSTGSSATINLPAIASSRNGRLLVVINDSGGSITLDGDGSDTINGSTTQSLNDGETAFLVYDNSGTDWRVISRFNGTW